MRQFLKYILWIKSTCFGRRNCPKHVEFHSKNKYEKLAHLVGFYYKKFNTMDGHMNVKFDKFCLESTQKREKQGSSRTVLNFDGYTGISLWINSSQ